MLKKQRAAIRTNDDSLPLRGGAPEQEVLDQESFLRMLYLEQKRTERSRRRFVLMLLESSRLLTSERNRDGFNQILLALAQSTRETDVTGWYKAGSVIGIIFTEIGQVDGKTVASALLTKISGALASALSIEEINQISISFHVFPEDWGDHDGGHSEGSALYPKPEQESGPKRASLAIKRMMDIVGSVFALALLSPLFLALALLVKLTSKGPVLFRQQRVGQYGKRFTFLKFRSMQVQNSTAVHQEYIKKFIAGNAEKDTQPGHAKVFKIKNDPRLTPIGSFLRKSSLDELPQFYNVLKGEMSLVGPRPPIPYEVDCYDIWHRRRLLAVKPGITGLWQVTGRSRVTFDEMVRLDLRYARTWTLWLDIKILLYTPRAVLGGAGAF